jgi:urease accessory protein
MIGKFGHIMNSRPGGRLPACIAILLAAGLPVAAVAHEANSLTYGSFLSGLTHPVLGWDHFLAMVCVGVVSAQIGGRAIFTVPATFVAVMAIGGLLGLMDIGLSAIEMGIAISVIALGSVIAGDKRLPLSLAMLGVAVFAVFHGYAHGAEIPTVAKPVTYAAGFLTGTAALHVLGLVIGDISQHYQKGKLVLRVAGVGIASTGILFLVNAAFA